VAKHMQAGCLGGHIPVLLFREGSALAGNIGCAEAEGVRMGAAMIVKEWPGIERSSLASAFGSRFKELFDEARRGDAIAAAIRTAA